MQNFGGSLAAGSMQSDAVLAPDKCQMLFPSAPCCPADIPQVVLAAKQEFLLFEGFQLSKEVDCLFI